MNLRYLFPAAWAVAGALAASAPLVAKAQDAGIAPPGQGSACASATSTVDIQNCQQAELAQANARLNLAYATRMASLDAPGKLRLRDEERAWIRRRDATCAVRPDSGSSGSLDVASCLLKQTTKRTSFLSAAR